MIVNLIILTVIIVFIVDMSGFTKSWKTVLSRVLTGNKISTDNYRLRPFDCSLCMTFWTGLIYICIYGFTLVNLFYVCVCCMLTGVIYNYLLLLQDILLCVHNKIYNYISKI